MDNCRTRRGQLRKPTAGHPGHGRHALTAGRAPPRHAASEPRRATGSRGQKLLGEAGHAHREWVARDPPSPRPARLSHRLRHGPPPGARHSPPRGALPAPHGCPAGAPHRPLHWSPDRRGCPPGTPPRSPGGPGCHGSWLEPQTAPQLHGHCPASSSPRSDHRAWPGPRVPFRAVTAQWAL